MSANTSETKSQTVPVTPDNFARAESDLYFGNIVKDDGFGKFMHIRVVTPIDHQPVIRMNRDTLYSGAVFDLNAGPVSITMPDAGNRFMSLQVIDEDHYVPAVFYGEGNYTLSKERIGTRYVVAAIRTLVNPNDSNDVQQVHALQDAIGVAQKNSGSFEVPNWDAVSQKKIRDALEVVGSTLPDSHDAFGARGHVEPVRHLIASAIAWGGNPEEDALYLNVTPAKNDGETVHKLTVGEVPVDGFWSISVYNAKGYFEPNEWNAYSVNNITAKKNTNDTITIQFGGCDSPAHNCLPIMPGWNYIVRLYRPREEVLNGSWEFPAAQPTKAGQATSGEPGKRAA